MVSFHPPSYVVVPHMYPLQVSSNPLPQQAIPGFDPFSYATLPEVYQQDRAGSDALCQQETAGSTALPEQEMARSDALPQQAIAGFNPFSYAILPQVYQQEITGSQALHEQWMVASESAASAVTA